MTQNLGKKKIVLETIETFLISLAVFCNIFIQCNSESWFSSSTSHNVLDPFEMESPMCFIYHISLL